MIKFSEIPYSRPDIDALKTELQALTDELKAAASYDEAKAAFLRKDSLERHIESVSTLAQIRHSIDTRDKFYDDEVRFWNMSFPEIQEYLQKWTEELLRSSYRGELEAEFGEVIFLNAEIDLKTFDPSIIPLLQEENDLTMEYEKLLASAQIPFC